MRGQTNSYAERHQRRREGIAFFVSCVQYSVQKLISVLYSCFPQCDNNDNYHLILYRPTSDYKYVGYIIQGAWTLGKYNYLIDKIADYINT